MSETNTDERQPLLTPTNGDSNHVPDIEQDPAVLATDEAAVAKKRDWWSILWSVVLWGGGLLMMVLLIKGFIDGGDTDFDLGKALKRALGGGLSGAAAMILQVLTLMPIRTVMNYQYRFGTTTTEATRTLYADGGWTRYYQGLTAALVQGPVSRFGDTAANAGVIAFLDSNGITKDWAPHIKTIFASAFAACFRMILTPVDTLKTTLQAQGRPGWDILKARIKRYGVGTLWFGAFATAAATFVGHYPWFSTYNWLSEVLPKDHTIAQKILRQAFIGFCASVVSDTISNSLRVVKTYRQVNETSVSYWQAAEAVIATDGLKGLFGRGLKTRILANGLQGLMFSILWKFFMDLWDSKTKS